MRRAVKDAAILAVWAQFDDEGVSTERLFQMVADTCDCDHGRIAAALRRKHEASSTGSEP